MRIEGELNIVVDSEGKQIAISSTRPLFACRLFEGKPCDETLRLVPLLFSVCGQAQGIAAIRAVESAANRPAGTQVEYQRERLNMLETLREHLWRILLDWPRFTQQASNQPILTQLMSLMQSLKLCLDPQHQLLTTVGLSQNEVNQCLYQQRCQTLQETVQQRLFSMPLAQWQALTIDQFDTWIETTQNEATALLKRVKQCRWERVGETHLGNTNKVDDAYIAKQLNSATSDSFIAQPHWHGEALQTGAAVRQTKPLLQDIARHHGTGLLYRLVARLCEVSDLLIQLGTANPEQLPGEACGLSSIEAARGRLWHQVMLDGEQIGRYRIVAPTEWNFHPRGAVAQALSNLRNDSQQDRRTQAELLIHAIDPCVGYTLNMEAAHA